MSRHHSNNLHKSKDNKKINVNVNCNNIISLTGTAGTTGTSGMTGSSTGSLTRSVLWWNSGGSGLFKQVFLNWGSTDDVTIEERGQILVSLPFGPVQPTVNNFTVTLYQPAKDNVLCELRNNKNPTPLLSVIIVPGQLTSSISSFTPPTILPGDNLSVKLTYMGTDSSDFFFGAKASVNVVI